MAIEILIDGADMSGKTTTINEFIRGCEKPYEVRHLRLSTYNPVHLFARQKRKEYNHDFNRELASLYQAAIIADLRFFELEKHEVPIIQDSIIATRCFADYFAIGRYDIADEFDVLLSKYPKPKHSFYFTTAMTERSRRLEKRIREQPESITPTDLFIHTEPKRFERLEEATRNASIKHFNSVVIDNTEMSVQNVVDKIIEQILLVRE